MADNETVFIDAGGDVSADVAEALADMLTTAERPQPGQEIGNAGGVPIKARRNRSMVTMNGVELPERYPVYDRFGNRSMVPTAQLAYHLTKNGGALRRQPPEGVKPKEWIEQGCDWCAKVRVDGTPKRFLEYDDYESHCEDKHPREWARKMRREERELSRPVITVADIRDALRELSPEDIAEITRTATPRRKAS